LVRFFQPPEKSTGAGTAALVSGCDQFGPDGY
jgi:hypothetical protein